MFIDSHAHLCYETDTKEAELLITRAKDAGVDKIINVICDRKSIDAVLSFTEQQKKKAPLDLFSTCGYHPDTYAMPNAEDAVNEVGQMEEELKEYVQQYKNVVVAIGECGLDYYREFDSKAQLALFEMQIRVSLELDLPLIIHVRDAWEDFFEVMKRYPEARGVLHCFTRDTSILSRVLEETNLYISYSGIVTFKNALDIQEAAKATPLPRMLVETDTPFLAPAPHRGKRNEPAYVIHVGEKIAELHGVSVEEVARVTSTNTEQLFGI